MELGVVWTHNCAIVANQFLTRVTEVTEELIVQETLLFKDGIHLVRVGVGEASSMVVTRTT